MGPYNGKASKLTSLGPCHICDHNFLKRLFATKEYYVEIPDPASPIRIYHPPWLGAEISGPP